ncbi:GH116 family glycosyl-hydrolase [Phytoactinopolyspora limicola]|uniref:GH116 family glycosyl-hydrolase n=1 Tax=Phytoactinopolyspora limicola TaxID=2715536 RepID=UPI001A9C341B|nr:GH116 family glycosyl-hydrolase [Phytoactinopolyspora limicola]
MAARREIRSVDGPHVAMPLGGIGTGNLALGADGGLRQWQLHNIGNHLGDLPGSFFALRATQWEPPIDELRVLQARPPATPPLPTPLVNDDTLPDWQHQLASRHGVDATTFAATYPVADVTFHDGALPLDVRLRALTPMVPLDPDVSGLPVAMFTFSLTNTGAYPVHGWLGAALQNAIGYDGVSPIHGTRFPGYGGNTNRTVRAGGWTHLLLENSTLDPAAAGAGQMLLGCDTPAAAASAQWSEPAEFMAFLRGRGARLPAEFGRAAPHIPDFQSSAPPVHGGASPAGQTWNGGLAAPFHLEPGAHVSIRYLLAWHFPNRYVNFQQFGPPQPAWGPTRFWLGNHYTQAYEDARDVARDVTERWTDLVDATTAWTDLLDESALDATTTEHLAAQASTPRSPSCFRTADGTFFGFEGVLGASTVMWSGDIGGSCPLNCTHVWNYAQAMATLFPTLERDMRQTELDVMQAPDGSIPHRVIVPTYLRQLWDVGIGGPHEPALDGMLGAVLKTYREVRNGAGVGWLAGYWPHVLRLMEHITGRWDPHGTAVLRGVQPSTHDIDLHGVNSFMGSLWLAALRATEEMARLVDDDATAQAVRERFEKGSAAYDTLLFDGEYYIQVLDPDESTDYQWGAGCLSDQLIGQWWAHQLDLGHILPPDHVRSALRAVVRHNLRRGFRDVDHGQRVFADGDDTGLLMCSWPAGGRPGVPTRYCDEVWTGTEYQVAAHCLYEGLTDEAHAILDGVWARYDGRRRNPYNEIECGDHYVRAMAGWSVLDALTGVRWNAATGALRLARPPEGGGWPLVLDHGWGRAVESGGAVRLECTSGAFTLRSIEVVAAAEVVAQEVFAEPLTITAGASFTLPVRG